MINPTSVRSRGVVFKLGVGFLAMAVILWLSPMYVPFTPLNAPTKAGVIAICIFIAEIIFWLGVLSLGREYFDKLKVRFYPKNWRFASSKNKAE